ncbi:hypothetical protein Dda_9271 [Drechslerella dactyloides]|uniref:C3H1-type domain-containing protein n=1 Tax=Drechslerella dactyloides TaxID=74499 RepID=A0AAD6IPG0_DREDA|nr:hypothetical protein Dda_9271 [Drechslerella dactyloides]
MSSLSGANIPADILSAMAQTPCVVMVARGVCNVGDCHYDHEKKNFFCTEERSYGRCKSSKCLFKHKRDTNGVPIEQSARTLRRLTENRPDSEEYDDGRNFIRHVTSPAAKRPLRAQPLAPSTPVNRGPSQAAPSTAGEPGPAHDGGIPNRISQGTLQDLSQIEGPRVVMKNGVPVKPRPALPPAAPTPTPKRLTLASAPDPVVSDRRERDLIMGFKAPLLSPLPLNEIERRNLLDTALRMLNHDKRYMKRFAVRLLSEARPVSHLVDIANALLAGDVDEEACTLVVFQTRCIPFMQILGHDYLEADEEVANSAKKILNDVFPEPIQAMHLIVRTIASFHQHHTLPENETVAWPEMYLSILRFLTIFAKLYSKIEEITSAAIIVYWAILFLEESRDSWYPDQSKREAVFDAIVQAVGLYKVDQYFAAETNQRGALDSIRRLPCPALKDNQKCADNEDDNCFFSHEAHTITAKYVDKTNKQFSSMEQWLQFGTQNKVLSIADLRKYWDQGLSFFNDGHENFVVEALTLPEGLLHIGQVLQLHVEEVGELQFGQVESFLQIMSSSRLENQTTIDIKIAEVAQYCAKVPSFFTFWCGFVRAGLAKDSCNQDSLNIAVLLIGFARFTVNLNPIQKIDKSARQAMINLCRIVADSNEEGTGPMSDAHDIAERLGFVIRRNLIMGTIDIIDRDLPDTNDINLDDEPLVFLDDETTSMSEAQTEAQEPHGRRDVRGMPCDQLEGVLSDLKNTFKQNSRSMPLFLSAMEVEGKFAVLKSFFASQHEYNDPTEATANVGIFPHLLPFLSTLGRFLKGRDAGKDPLLRESQRDLFQKMWTGNEFTVFFCNATKDFYLLHGDYYSLDDITKRRVRKSFEGMLYLVATLQKLELLPRADPNLEKLILRFLRMVTDFDSPNWAAVQALVVQVVGVLGLRRHFIDLNLGEDAPPKFSFRYPKTFRCPESKLSRCQFPQHCQYDHVEEDLSTPSPSSPTSSEGSLSPSPPPADKPLHVPSHLEDLIDLDFNL